jgi:hypothetical protein
MPSSHPDPDTHHALVAFGLAAAGCVLCVSRSLSYLLSVAGVAPNLNCPSSQAKPDLHEHYGELTLAALDPHPKRRSVGRTQSTDTTRT